MLEVTVKNRLLTFIEHENITASEFERRCGLSHGYVSHIRRSISDSVCSTIAHQFPNIDTRWLMTGEGSMLMNVSGDDRETVISRYEEMLASRDARIRELERTILSQQRQIDILKKQITQYNGL